MTTYIINEFVKKYYNTDLYVKYRYRIWDELIDVIENIDIRVIDEDDIIIDE